MQGHLALACCSTLFTYYAVRLVQTFAYLCYCLWNTFSRSSTKYTKHGSGMIDQYSGVLQDVSYIALLNASHAMIPKNEKKKKSHVAGLN